MGVWTGGNPGKTVRFPVTFRFCGKEITGTLTEINGMQHRWFLHHNDLINILVFDGELRWQKPSRELTEQIEDFREVLVRWYQ